MIIWALFDSGNGSYTKVAKNMPGVEIYPIGLDIENKNDHFINLNLADYSYHFTKENIIFNELDKLPHPDLIIASPPCESWSVASAMEKGNACWKQERGDSLFEPQTPLSKFTIRDNLDFENHAYSQEKAFVTRVNGELTIFNTIQIIKRYKPKYHIIENPAFGRIWDYIKEVLGFKITYENLTYYNNYDYPIKKPTKFGSNINLNLSKEQKRNEIKWDEMKGYNNRSNIPEKLVKDIFEKVKSKIELEGKEEQNA